MSLTYLYIEMMKAAILDDHPIVADGLQKILREDFSISRVEQFISGEEFTNYLKGSRETFELVLLDIALPGKSGIEICKEIKVQNPGTCVVVFSNYTERSIIMQMLQNGANGYLLKNASSFEIVAGITEALNGKIAFSREVQEIIARPSSTDLKKIPSLTKREKEILKMIADGKTSVEIGEQLFVSPFTVDTHRRNLMQKFEVKNVAALIRLAMENGLIMG